MNRTYRSKEELIKYFKQLSYQYGVSANRSKDLIIKAMEQGKAEAYELAAFEVERNLK